MDQVNGTESAADARRTRRFSRLPERIRLEDTVAERPASPLPRPTPPSPRTGGSYAWAVSEMLHRKTIVRLTSIATAGAVAIGCFLGVF